MNVIVFYLEPKVRILNRNALNLISLDLSRFHFCYMHFFFFENDWIAQWFSYPPLTHLPSFQSFAGTFPAMEVILSYVCKVFSPCLCKQEFNSTSFGSIFFDRATLVVPKRANDPLRFINNGPTARVLKASSTSQSQRENYMNWKHKST